MILQALLAKRTESNLETDTCPLLYNKKAVDEVWRPLIYCILQDRNILNPLLTAIIKIFENNEIKMKLDHTLTQPKS